MFLSKIWFVLVALLAGVATTAAFVAPRSADRRLGDLEAQRLDRAQYAAEQMLKTDAHRWIDYVAKLGRDAPLAESLDSASRGQGEPKLVHETVRRRLAALVPDLENLGARALVAIDAKGRVVARLGEGESTYGDSEAGIEVVADALRGYMSDDAWASGGKIARVAAAPVLSKTRDRIVGAVYVAAYAGQRLVELWKKNLGVDVALLLGGKVVHASLPESYFDGLPAMVQERQRDIAQAKRTHAMAVRVGTERFLAVAAPFTGQASQLGAYYVLIGKQAPVASPLLLLTGITADDLKWGNFPWLGLGGGLLGILIMGLWLQRLEMETPLARLRAEAAQLARGEIQTLRDSDHAGKFGGIARDVNAAMERFTHAPAPRSETAKKDLGAILGGLGGDPAGARTFDLAMPGAMPQARLASPTFLTPAAKPGSPGGPPPVPRSPAPPAPSPAAFAPIATPITVPALPEDSEEAHVRDVFDQYLAARQQCGEAVAGLTLDKFSAKLAANREALIAKHGCRTARFSVYVKEGKAAIKAAAIN